VPSRYSSKQFLPVEQRIVVHVINRWLENVTLWPWNTKFFSLKGAHLKLIVSRVIFRKNRMEWSLFGSNRWLHNASRVIRKEWTMNLNLAYSPLSVMLNLFQHLQTHVHGSRNKFGWHTFICCFTTCLVFAQQSPHGRLSWSAKHATRLNHGRWDGCSFNHNSTGFALKGNISLFRVNRVMKSLSSQNSNLSALRVIPMFTNQNLERIAFASFKRFVDHSRHERETSTNSFPLLGQHSFVSCEAVMNAPQRIVLPEHRWSAVRSSKRISSNDCTKSWTSEVSCWLLSLS